MFFASTMFSPAKITLRPLCAARIAPAFGGSHSLGAYPFAAESFQWNPMMTTWTCAFSNESESQTKERCAKSISSPFTKSGFHIAATDSPWQMELVETNAAWVGVPAIRSRAFLYHAQT